MDRDSTDDKVVTDPEQAIPREANDAVEEADKSADRSTKTRYFLIGFLVAAIIGTVIGVTVSQTKDDDSTSTPVPTLPAIQLPVETTYTIQINDVASPESYIPDLEAAMDILAVEVVAETFPRTRMRRKLLVTMSEEATEIVGRVTVACPQDVSSAGIVCEEISSVSKLELVDEDEHHVETSYASNLNTAIEDGRLQEALVEIEPNSPVSVLDCSPSTPTPSTPVPSTQAPTTLVPTTLTPTTPVPTTPVPSTPAPTTYEELLRSLLAEKSPWSTDALEIPGSAQSQAFDWLLTDEITTSMDEPDEDRILQRYSLAVLFYAMDDADFMDDTWLEATDECTWRRIEACSSEGAVKNLTIHQDNMNGLPLELGLLTNLVEFDAFSDVFGSNIPSAIFLLPTTIGLWTDLRRLDVAYYVDGVPNEENYSCGPIPSEIGLMTGLRDASTGGAFTGIIPTEIGALVELERLRLGGGLTGPIPSEIKKLTNLTRLSLNGNRLGGSIPVELASLSMLSYLGLGGNPLGGPLISELGLLTKLTHLSVQGCDLVGPIPSEMGDLTLLQTLRLAENSFTSTIPTQLGQLLDLYTMNLASNQLQGAIPSEIGNIKGRLGDLWLEDNMLNSTLPTELGLLTRLELFRANNNELRGKIPPQISSLSNLGVLHLDHNQLTGPIPSELRHLTNLRSLYLNDNKIDGVIPSVLGEISNLHRLFLHNLDLVGKVPDSICALTSLYPFYFTVDCSAVACPCCHVCESRDIEVIAQYDWVEGATDTKKSFHPIEHHGKLDEGVTAKDGVLTVFEWHGVDLGPIPELDEATEVLFRFENVNITDSRNYGFHVLLGGGYHKWWVAIHYDQFWSGTFYVGGRLFMYNIGSGALFDSIEYFFNGSQPSDRRLAIRYNDGEWARGGWTNSTWFTSFPVSDEIVKINDGGRSYMAAPMNATLGEVTISANRP